MKVELREIGEIPDARHLWIKEVLRGNELANQRCRRNLSGPRPSYTTTRVAKVHCYPWSYYFYVAARRSWPRVVDRYSRAVICSPDGLLNGRYMYYTDHRH